MALKVNFMYTHIPALPASLRRCPQGEQVQRILEAALNAVDPAVCVENALHRSGDTLSLGDQVYDLTSFRRVFVIGMGKAAAPMSGALVRILGDVFTQGAVVVKDGYAEGYAQNGVSLLTPRLRVIEAAHPVPDARGVSATRHILDLVRGLTSADLVLCVISGGGSALFTSPVHGLTLKDLQTLTAALLACGATINEINTLRQCLDEVKGGGLARHCAPARLAALVLSDVVGDPLEFIASGPTVPPQASAEQAWQILEKYSLLQKVPKPVSDVLQTRLRGQALAADEEYKERVQTVVVGSNRLAAQAALRQAHEEGFHTLLLTTYLQGEARTVGNVLAAIARQMDASGAPIPRPACLVAGGETTVTLQGDGLGGRNQELALAAAPFLSGLKDVLLVSLATDGGDGPTDAAGGVVTGETQARAAARGMAVDAFLARNDSYHFFEALEDLLKTGATQTNVNDLAFLFAF